MKQNNTTFETYKDYHTIFRPKHDAVIFPELIYRHICNRVRGKVLDIGTGDGYKLKNVLNGCDHSKISTITGIEPSPLSTNAIESFKDTAITVLQTDWQNFYPAVTTKFDTILCFEVLEHVQNQHQFLSAIASMLAPDGCFICSTPNRPVYRLSCKVTGETPDPTHISELNMQELKKLMAGHFKHTIYKGFFPYMKLYQKYRYFNFIDHIMPIIGWTRTFYCFAEN